MYRTDPTSSWKRPLQGFLVCPWAALAIALLPPLVAAAGQQAVSEAKEASPGQQGKKAKLPKWQSLFDGKKLGQWKVIDQFDYSRHGRVYVKDGAIVQEAGKPATGIRWTGKFPKVDYEVTLEAKRIDGQDFFCGMTFPIAEPPPAKKPAPAGKPAPVVQPALTLILGGWGGSVVGLSSIDGEPAVENETCTCQDFEQNRWYRIRLRVVKERIEAWIDDKRVVDLPTAHRKFTIYWEVEPCLPFGIATWYTTGALRDIRVRLIEGEPVEKP